MGFVHDDPGEVDPRDFLNGLIGRYNEPGEVGGQVVLAAQRRDRYVGGPLLKGAQGLLQEEKGRDE